MSSTSVRADHNDKHWGAESVCELERHEHDDVLVELSVDQKKAYNSVSRSALWRVLKRCRTPTIRLSIIQYSMTVCRLRLECTMVYSKTFQHLNTMVE